MEQFKTQGCQPWWYHQTSRICAGQGQLEGVHHWLVRKKKHSKIEDGSQGHKTEQLQSADGNHLHLPQEGAEGGETIFFYEPQWLLVVKVLKGQQYKENICHTYLLNPVAPKVQLHMFYIRSFKSNRMITWLMWGNRGWTFTARPCDAINFSY